MKKEDRRYKIIAGDGTEMPDHWSGRRRTYQEAKELIERLNKHGEYKPYKMAKV